MYLSDLTNKMINEVVNFSLIEVLAWLRSLGFECEIVENEVVGNYVCATDKVGGEYWFCSDDDETFCGWIEDQSFIDD